MIDVTAHICVKAFKGLVLVCFVFDAVGGKERLLQQIKLEVRAVECQSERMISFHLHMVTA